MICENQMVAEGFSLRIGLRCNTDPKTQPEGCGYQEITARRGHLSRAKSRTRRSRLHNKVLEFVSNILHKDTSPPQGEEVSEERSTLFEISEKVQESLITPIRNRLYNLEIN